MARSFSNSRLMSDYVLDKISIALKSRGYVVGVETKEVVSERSNVMLRKGGEGGKVASSSAATTPWVPDHRPENVATEIGVVELRKLLLNPKIC
ncbi:hypothetical protein LIER_07771 [Lithospermum erythrorhizon]|uniref:Uncharacterized protein n=1 Tax=Lithospermum erythrorhizon TaxID=34254 RepID=A0AAV3P9I5_LITER